MEFVGELSGTGSAWFHLGEVFDEFVQEGGEIIEARSPAPYPPKKPKRKSLFLPNRLARARGWEAHNLAFCHVRL